MSEANCSESDLNLLLCDVITELNKGVEMANIYFKDNDIKAKSFPPYAFCVGNLGKENEGT